MLLPFVLGLILALALALALRVPMLVWSCHCIFDLWFKVLETRVLRGLNKKNDEFRDFDMFDFVLF